MTLELRNIEKSFGAKQVLQGITLTAEGGQAFGLLGRNGAGKTTTIRILMDVFPPNSGEILLDGKPIDYRKVSLGYLPEERGLYPKKPIGQQLVYFAQLKGMTRRDATTAVRRWLEKYHIKIYHTFPEKKSPFFGPFSGILILIRLLLFSFQFYSPGNPQRDPHFCHQKQNRGSSVADKRQSDACRRQKPGNNSNIKDHLQGNMRKNSCRNQRTIQIRRIF